MPEVRLPGLLGTLPRLEFTSEPAPNRREAERTDKAYSIRSAADLQRAMRLKLRK